MVYTSSAKLWRPEAHPMPWKEASAMTLRREFVALAQGQDGSVAQLCQRFGISRTTGYKWLGREAAGEPLVDRSRRPYRSPRQTDEVMQARVVALRKQFPSWGGRKLAKVLAREGFEPPAPSTITHILRRHGLLWRPTEAVVKPWQRFEHAGPNDLWQMDFKGTVPIGSTRCDPLTVLDDHSRFNLVLANNADMKGETVQRLLTTAFRRYGLPLRMNMDNGTPWGVGYGPARHLSTLSVWLVELGIHLSFSRPFHPQTNGKDERFHRSLDVEVLRGRAFRDLAELGRALDHWREIYNHIRPHQGIGMATPAERYRLSPRAFPARIETFEYGPDDILMRIDQRGRAKLQGRLLTVSSALKTQIVAARPVQAQDGLYDLYFRHHWLDTVNLRDLG
jgi:transposase InsO family protein